jgi:hypothetical protein
MGSVPRTHGEKRGLYRVLIGKLKRETSVSREYTAFIFTVECDL